MIFFSKLDLILLEYFDPTYNIFEMKTDNIRAILTDISVKRQAVFQTITSLHKYTQDYSSNVV